MPATRDDESVARHADSGQMCDESASITGTDPRSSHPGPPPKASQMCDTHPPTDLRHGGSVGKFETRLPTALEPTRPLLLFVSVRLGSLPVDKGWDHQRYGCLQWPKAHNSNSTEAIQPATSGACRSGAWRCRVACPGSARPAPNRGGGRGQAPGTTWSLGRPCRSRVGESRFRLRPAVGGRGPCPDTPGTARRT